MKHRAGSSKIKYQHKMIHGLRDFLENEIEPLDYVISIIPGQIKPKKGVSSKFSIKFQYETNTGVKLLASSPQAVQEVFIVTRNREALKRYLEQRMSKA